MPSGVLEGTVNPLNLTKESLIPFKYRIVGRQKILWLFDLPITYLKILPEARNNDGDILANRYDIIDCIKSIFKSRSEQRALSSVGQLEVARMRKLTVDTEREVIKNEMLKGKLVRIEDADAEVADMIMAVRGKLLGYPSHVARLILGKEDYDEVVRILTQVMEQILADLKTLDYSSVMGRNGKLVRATGVEAFDTVSNEEVDFTEDGEAKEKRGPGRPRKDEQ